MPRAPRTPRTSEPAADGAPAQKAPAGRKPAAPRAPAGDRVRKQSEAKVRLGLEAIQPYTSLFGALGLSDKEIGDVARVVGKLAAKHEPIAKAINETEEASVYADAVVVLGTAVFRRKILIETDGAIDIESETGLLDYLMYRSLRAANQQAPDTVEFVPDGVVTSPV